MPRLPVGSTRSPVRRTKSATQKKKKIGVVDLDTEIHVREEKLARLQALAARFDSIHKEMLVLRKEVFALRDAHAIENTLKKIVHG